MAPVNSAPSPEMDNEATAELPVLDLAAYESTLNGDEGSAHTDTFALPGGALTPKRPPRCRLRVSRPFPR
jgi:hypothetical protein